MGFIDEIKTKAKADLKTIVLPETEDVRTYEAAEAILKEGTAKLVLIGSEEEVAKNKGNFDISGAQIVDPAKSEKTESYIAKLVELRQKKGMTEEQARELLLTNYPYYGVMMVKMGDADGMDSGACRYLASVFTDPEDETGHQARIRIFYHGSAGLRDGGEWYIRIRRLRSKPESEPGRAGSNRNLFRREF